MIVCLLFITAALCTLSLCRYVTAEHYSYCWLSSAMLCVYYTMCTMCIYVYCVSKKEKRIATIKHSSGICFAKPNSELYMKFYLIFQCTEYIIIFFDSKKTNQKTVGPQRKKLLPLHRTYHRRPQQLLASHNNNMQAISLLAHSGLLAANQ